MTHDETRLCLCSGMFRLVPCFPPIRTLHSELCKELSFQTNGKTKREDVSHTGRAQGTCGASHVGNSGVIRKEFRGNSDRKKGIQTNSGKNVTRLQGILEAETTPSSPYIILKGFRRGKRECFAAGRGSRHMCRQEFPSRWSRILLSVWSTMV